MPQLDLFSAVPPVDLDGPLVCRVPTEEEKRAFAEEFPEYVAPWPPLEGNACYDCGAGEGQKHADTCDDAGAVVPTAAPAPARCRSIHRVAGVDHRCTDDEGHLEKYPGAPHGRGMYFWHDDEGKFNACTICEKAVRRPAKVHAACARAK